jgi:threonine-phosphate decarboxylase
MSSGVCPIGPSKKIKAAIRKAVKDIRHFPEPEVRKLTKLFSSKYRLQEECILWGSSMEEIMCLIPVVFNPARILIIGPALRLYEQAASVTGTEVAYITADEQSGFLPDRKVIQEEIKKGDMLFLANPNRISGRLSEEKQLIDLIADAASRGVKVVIDEALIEFTDRDGFIGHCSEKENLIIVRSSAYFYGLPGLEIACAIASPADIAELRKKQKASMNTLALEAAGTAFKDKTYQKRVRQYVHDEKKFIRTKLKQYDAIKIYDSDTNVLLMTSDHFDRKIIDVFARAGLRVENGEGIQGLTSAYIVLSVMSHAQNKKITRILIDCLERAVAER